MKRIAIVAVSLALATASGVATGVNWSVFSTSAVAETVPSSPSPAAPPTISLADVMAARSPGERGRVHFLTKVKASPLSMAKPRMPQRTVVAVPPGAGVPVLGTPSIERVADVPGDVVLPLDDGGTGGIDFGDIVETAPPVPVVSETPDYPIVPAIVPLTPIAPSNPVVPLTPVIPPVTGAVPEPTTWMMMLTGFGAIAASMRRRNRTARVERA